MEEDKELKEKLLCVLYKEAGKIKHIFHTYGISSCSSEFFYLKNKDIEVVINRKPIFEYKTTTENIITLPKYFWQKEKVKTVTKNERIFLYNEGEIEFQGKSFSITKEELEKILDLREKQIKQNQLETLDKICNTN